MLHTSTHPPTFLPSSPRVRLPSGPGNPPPPRRLPFFQIARALNVPYDDTHVNVGVEFVRSPNLLLMQVQGGY